MVALLGFFQDYEARRLSSGLGQAVAASSIFETRSAS
jgi:hypothetical protein